MHIAIGLPFSESRLLELIESLHFDTLTLNLDTLKVESFLDKVALMGYKVNVFGKWYDTSLVDTIKNLLKQTGGSSVINLCINYDGQEEILDACKLIARQVKAGKLDPESILKEDIKENLYTSEVSPPDVIVQVHGAPFLLWDGYTSRIIYVKESIKAKQLIRLLKA
ncbi:MAG: undecaprenyl diphosphate synthase family protein [Nanobdellota archaeon]